MARFSIGTAIGEAFSLVRRRPLSVFVWGLLLMAPVMAGMGLMLPMMGDLLSDMPAHGGDPDHWGPEFHARMMQFQGANALMQLGQLALTVVVYTAIMRAVVRPKERSFFSLRLGMDELAVLVVGIAVIVGLYAGMIVLGLLGAGIGFSVWSLGAPANGLIIAAMVVVFVLAILLALARVSLIAPASVLTRSFAFVEGWRMGRDRTGALFGMSVLIVLIILAIELVLMAIGFGVFAVAANAGMDWSLHRGPMHGNPFAGAEPYLRAHWPWLALAAVAFSGVYGMLITLSVAPYASACRQLATGAAPTADDAH